MFEYHGWLAVCAAPHETETEDADLRAVVDFLRQLLDADSALPGLRDLRWVNGSPQYHFGGFTNHRGSDFDSVLSGVKSVAEQAPGSYGLIHFVDDEDPRHRNTFRVLVVRRGEISEHADQFLSPIIPVIEDAYVSKD